MNERRCMVPEEWIVDLVQERLAPHKANRLLEHAGGCARCRELIREWSAVLRAAEAENPPARDLRFGREMPPAREVPFARQKTQTRRLTREGEGRRSSEINRSLPQKGLSLRLRKRIMFHARLRFGIMRIRRGLNWRTVSAACAGVFSLMLIIGLLRFPTAPEPIPVASIWPQPSTPIVSQPGATKYSAYDASGSRPVTGEVWLNNASGEMLLIVNGVGPDYGFDYQAWSMKEDSLYSIGILNRIDQIGYLYTNELRIQEPDHIIVSVEPKGGSPAPTGPETIRIGLNP